MKKFKTIIALILALLMIPMCLLACDKGEGEGSGDGQTEDPNDTTDGIRVSITISGLEDKEGLRTPLIKTKETEAFRVAPGTTLKDAVDALCKSRENASFEIDMEGKFYLFKYGSDELVAEPEQQKDGTYVPYTFEIKVNGTVVTDKEAPGYVLNHNDNVEIYLVKGEPYAA